MHSLQCIINLNYSILTLTLPNSVHSNMFPDLHAIIINRKHLKTQCEQKSTAPHSLPFQETKETINFSEQQFEEVFCTPGPERRGQSGTQPGYQAWF